MAIYHKGRTSIALCCSIGNQQASDSGDQRGKERCCGSCVAIPPRFQASYSSNVQAKVLQAHPQNGNEENQIAFDTSRFSIFFFTTKRY